MDRLRLSRRRTGPGGTAGPVGWYRTARARLRRFGAGTPGARFEAVIRCLLAVAAAVVLGGATAIATGSTLIAVAAAAPVALASGWALWQVDLGARRARRTGRSAAVAWFRAERLAALGPDPDADVEVRVAGSTMQCPTARVRRHIALVARRHRDDAHLPDLVEVADELTAQAFEAVVDGVRHGALEPAGRRVHGQLVLVAATPSDHCTQRVLNRLGDISDGLWRLDRAVGTVDRGTSKVHTAELAERARRMALDLDTDTDTDTGAHDSSRVAEPNRWS